MPRIIGGAVLAFWITSIAASADAQSIQGTATYRERMTLPAGAVLDAVLEDVSRADAPAIVLGRARVTAPGNPPIAFAITYEPSKIVATNRYVVRATIVVNGKPLFITETATPVITYGGPTRVEMILRKAATTPANPKTARPLEGTYWKAVELAGQPAPEQDANREAYLVFKTGRVFGSDGCNRFSGTYQLTGDAVTFGQMAGTQMACASTGHLDRRFREVLQGAQRLTRVGDGLEFFDATGKRAAAFVAATPPPRPAPSTAGLPGTSWRLVMFRSGDGSTSMPDDRNKYTIDFGSDGKVSVRIDCNRGSGTWKTSGKNQLIFGPLALTRAECPSGSLHDQIVKQWVNIRSYVTKDGHLFLALMADGGIYEFEPVPTLPRPGR